MAEAPPRAATSEGVYEGRRTRSGVVVFRGIRYASVPARWAPPASAPAFPGVRAARAFGPSCPQAAGGDAAYRAAARAAGLDERAFSLRLGRVDEDCLFLNIWSPAGAGGEPRPVLVWIHGGGSEYGTASRSLYSGRALAEEQGVVVVTLNYRVGVLGYLAHPALVAESGEGSAGNYGLLDQIAALGWLRENLAAFGGDPGRVTVFGNSSGGRAVLELLTAPAARGLLQRAIAQSPWDAPHHYRRLAGGGAGMEPAVELGRRLAERVGVDDGAAGLARLRAAPAAVIVAAAAGLGSRIFAPILDGVVLPEHPLAALARGRSQRLPLIVGSTADEGEIFFVDGNPLGDELSYRRWVERQFGADAAEVLERYPPSSDPGRLRASVARLFGDRGFVLPALAAARAVSRAAPVWLYRFSHVHRPFRRLALAERGPRVGAYHGSEVPLLFGSDGQAALDERDRPLGRELRGYWARFAESGDPNGGGGVDWPRFDAAGEAWLELGDTARARSRPYLETEALLARSLRRRLGLEDGGGVEKAG